VLLVEVLLVLTVLVAATDRIARLASPDSPSDWSAP